jgi:hypothetical protein
MGDIGSLCIDIEVKVLQEDENGAIARMRLSGPGAGNRTIESYNFYPRNLVTFPSEEVCP